MKNLETADAIRQKLGWITNQINQSIGQQNLQTISSADSEYIKSFMTPDELPRYAQIIDENYDSRHWAELRSCY